MTSNEFVIWLKGFVAGSNNYALTPKGWDEVKEQLEKVTTYTPVGIGGAGYVTTTTYDKLDSNG